MDLGCEKQIAVLPTIFQNGSFVIVSPERVLKPKAPRHRTGDRNGIMVGWTNRLVRGYSTCHRRVRRFVGFRFGTSVAKLIRAEPNEQHVLLLLDASWPYDIWPAIEALKMRGLHVISVIYDLIPLTHSHTVVESLVRAFDRWLQGQMCFADSVVCISRAMADVVGNYFEEKMPSAGLARSIPVSSFYLGAELDFVRDAVSVQERVSTLKSVESPIFLMVGTIEPRKNHRHVFDAFRKLWAQGIDARLAIVGARDWKSEDLLAEIAEHPEAGRRLFLIRDASDADVKWFYENATALIMASEVEGFGLPIVEARQMGLSVICSDIPVFAELAAPGTAFFRLGDVDDLARVIVSHLGSRPVRSGTKGGWITWRESSQQLLGAVLRSVPCSNGSG
jgi:alpha-1,2-rhamnosyltransferase